MPLPFLSTYLPDLALERKPVTTHSEMRLTATTKSTFFVGTVEGGKGTLFFFSLTSRIHLDAKLSSINTTIIKRKSHVLSFKSV